MTNYSQIVNAAEFFIVAGFWVYVFCVMIPYARLDSFRQDMFALRDEMFIYAADGNISFRHPAYILARRQMNGFIRYGHQLTMFRSCLTIAIHAVSGVSAKSDWHEKWEKSVSTIQSESVRKDVEYFQRRAMLLVMRKLITGSPVLLALTGFFLVQDILQGVQQSLAQHAKNAAKKAFARSVDYRVIEEAAQGEFA
jgi:hypothetical protein